MEEIRKILLTYECSRCGNKIKKERTIVLDEFLKQIGIPSVKCSCGKGSRCIIDLDVLNLDEYAEYQEIVNKETKTQKQPL